MYWSQTTKRYTPEALIPLSHQPARKPLADRTGNRLGTVVR
jgi:hypothetical protein